MKKPVYFIRKGSPHILSYNPNFLRDSDYSALPDDFDVLSYQEHMKQTKGKPTKSVDCFIKSKSSPVPDKLQEKGEDKTDAVDNKKPVFTSATLSMVDDSVTNADKNTDINLEEFEERRPEEPRISDLYPMRKEELIDFGKDIGLGLTDSMLKRDMLARIKEFLEEKKKEKYIESQR